MTELKTALASLDHRTRTFEEATADARISEEEEHDATLAVKAGREAWGRYVGAADVSKRGSAWRSWGSAQTC
ncbi:hypothetical protein CCAX7_14940 [Capsulimonas corticalis]|uniref:Uncharacterized protein n=1 Tax=Capsulimonas corticalis TaxID=2219043 RepID=A0A402CZF6_9BACT|nr:hypothetical protein [Capsulimonas corticalis]BDI29443.1 hypothetical protein CCAX7_14940 [Capsulimonas corticalis]